MIEEASEKRNNELEFELRLNARLCAIIYNANGVKKDNYKTFEMKDFLPEKKEAPQTVEELEYMVQMATLAAGGSVSNK